MKSLRTKWLRAYRSKLERLVYKLEDRVEEIGYELERIDPPPPPEPGSEAWMLYNEGRRMMAEIGRKYIMSGPYASLIGPEPFPPNAGEAKREL